MPNMTCTGWRGRGMQSTVGVARGGAGESAVGDTRPAHGAERGQEPESGTLEVGMSPTDNLEPQSQSLRLCVPDG
eukprot:1033764-Rhodomonas_salina.4